MNIIRPAIGIMLAVALVSPLAVGAQTDDLNGDSVGSVQVNQVWTNEDGLFYVTPLTDGLPPGGDDPAITISPPEDRPDIFAGIRMQSDFYTVSSTELGQGLGIVRVYDYDSNDALLQTDGRMQLVPQIGFDEDGVAWLGNQNQMRLPPACSGVSEEGNDCLDDAVRQGLIKYFVDRALGVGSLPPDLADADDGFLVVSKTDRPGSFFGLAGGITFDQFTSTSPQDGGIVLEGNIAVNETYGGRLRDVRAQFVNIDNTTGEFTFNPIDVSTVEGDGGITFDRPAGTWRIPVVCDQESGPALVATDVEVRRAGGGLPEALDDGFEPLEGGTSLIVTDITNIDCPGQPGGPGTDILDSPGTDPFDPSAPGSQVGAGLVCWSVQVRHDKLQVGSGDDLVEFLSYIEGRGVIMVRGTPEEMLTNMVFSDSGRVQTLINGPVPGYGPGGDLEGYFLLDPDPVARPASFYEFEFEAGIDSIGKKRIKKFEVRADGARVDLTEQARDAIGRDFIRVRAQETSGGNCPDDFDDLDIGYLPEVLPWVSE